MKKIIAKLLTLSLLVTALAIPMTACPDTSRLLRMEEGERAVAFYELVNEITGTATAGVLEQTMTMKLDIGDVSYEQNGVATVTYVETEDDFVYLEQSEVTAYTDGSKVVIYEDAGYMDGMMFSRVKDGLDEVKLKSPITAEEYVAYRDSRSEHTSLDIEVENGLATVMTCVQNEDQSWTATLQWLLRGWHGALSGAAGRHRAHRHGRA